ncbi:MAG: penicillin-binding protein 1C [Saprospiraceae bacterium]|nr:penicillin-binding protein 1C [Saprospiraceae bacterium]
MKLLSAFIFVGILVLCFVKYNPDRLFQQPLSTAVYDSDLQLLGARIAKDGQWRFGRSKDVPVKFIAALLTYEDQRFYQHPGIDARSLLASVYSQLGNSPVKRGGSTISMQVMRMGLNNQRRNLWSKLEEMAGAIFLEVSHSKVEILQYYLTNAPFGGNVVGVEAACWRYFNKPATDLSWAEAAMLAVLPNQPSMIHINKNRSGLLNKRNNLLLRLHTKGVLDTITYQLSVEEPLPEKPIPLPTYANHLVDHLTFSKNKSGIQLTSLSGDVQKFCTQIAQKYNDIYKEDQIDHLAILVLDNEKCHVVAYVGNAMASPIDMIMAKRSSGSILKPLLYMSMLDEGQITPWSLVPDIPIAINGYTPSNFDRAHRGAVPADEALQRSLNIPFVLLLRKFGIARFLDRLHKSGITTLNKNAEHYGLSLILGGGEVSLWEMCNTYSSITRILSEYPNNNGKYRIKAYHPALMYDQKWNFRTMPVQSSAPLFSASAVHSLVSSLQNLGRPDEEGRWEEFSSHRPLAWKTGTSFGHKDGWAIGFDKKYTIGVWVGNANGKARSNLTGIHRAAPVMFEVFNHLPEPAWFETPWDDLRPAEICQSSGFLASKDCISSEARYLGSKAMDAGICPFHQKLTISQTSGKRVLKECQTDEEIQESIYFVLPPEQELYYAKSHSDFKTIPVMDERCLEGGYSPNNATFSLIYPSENTKIFTPKDLSGTLQSVVFKASHYDRKAKIFWYLDGHFLGHTIEFHTFAVKTVAGKHRLTLTDETGKEITRKFELITQ